MILGTSAICLSLSHSHKFLRNFNGNGNKTVNVVAKTNGQTFSMVCTFIENGNEVKMFKTFHLSFELFDVISMFDKSTDHGKLSR